jgi:hypothetical protein
MEIVQSDKGAIEGSSGNATLPTGTQADSTVCIFTFSAAMTNNTPSGFTLDVHAGGAHHTNAFHKSGVAAAEQSWGLSTAVSTATVWVAVEVAGLDPNPVLAITAGNEVINGTVITTGQTGTIEVGPTIAFAVFGNYQSAGGSGLTWGSYTNGFTELQDVPYATGSSSDLGLGVAYLLPAAPTDVVCTATSQTSDGADAVLVVYKAADAIGPSIPVPVVMTSGN